jgi:uncharacterized protein (DUF305 family)
MRLRPPFSALALAAAVAACAPAQAQSGGPAPAPAPQPPAAAAPAPAATRARGVVDADVQFVHGMIGHHQQALTMAAMAPTHGASERLQLLAKKIDLSQRDEIASMTSWLAARRLPAPAAAGHEHHAAHMPGMLTPEQLAQLDAARGADFDRLFLTYMIQHHQGALTMVEQLFAAPGGGQEAELFQFASDVDADQRAEIHLMQQMLNSLPTRRTPSP